ncbi:MAG: hypothetical protein GY822_02990 [Deltaproteobacteria bacterium]|nr:hypothetical protein [Deltaproteobacteria bacterium]
MNPMQDGAHLTKGCSYPTHCETCEAPLGCEEWWVTEWPRGVHTRCRDWTKVGFPYQIKLEACQKLEARLRRDGVHEAAQFAKSASSWFLRRKMVWPTNAMQTVFAGAKLIDRLRAKLNEYGVPSKLQNSL